MIMLFICDSTKASIVMASTFGYSSTNATSAFRSAVLSASDTIIVDLQSHDWNVAPNTFNNLHNKTIIFQPGVTLRAIPGLFNDTGACLLRFNSCTNISLIGYGATLKMNKSEYALLNDSEFRMSISIWHCSNVNILGLIIDESGGDGIYVGGDGLNYCDKIFIQDIQCINHYRQGMSITNVQDMTVKNSYFSNTKGTLPEAGIDVEPYQTSQRIVNLSIEDCRFENNGWAGLALALGSLDSTSLPVSIEVKDCLLKKNSSPTNTYAHCELFVSADAFSPVRGNVEFERCFIIESLFSAYYSRKTADAFSVKFKDCVFQNVSQLQETYNEPIFLEVPNYNITSPYLGGLHFENVFISYTTNFSFFRIYGWSTLPGIKDITGKFIVVEPNNNKALYTNVPDTLNCGYTYSNQTSLPATSVGIIDKNITALECNQQHAIFEVNRESSDISYPLGVSYTNSGTVSLGDDAHLLTQGLILAADAKVFAEHVSARHDSITESVESLSFEIQSSEFYDAISNNGAVIEFKDCEEVTADDLEVAGLRIYPNPVSSQLIIENSRNDAIIVSVYNIFGVLVYSVNIFETELIDIEALANGVYFIRIFNIVNKRNRFEKIIKN